MRIGGVETVYQGWLRLLRARLTGPGGEAVVREIEDHGQAAAVLPYDVRRRVAMMIRIPRAPVIFRGGPERLLEAPAGMIDDDEAPEACVRREALEETGLRLGALDPVAHAYSMPGVSTEALHLYLAPYAAADRIALGGGVAHEHEDIEVVEIALADLWAACERREIADLKTLALILSLRLRRPDLFASA